MNHQAFEYHTEFSPLNYLIRTKKLFMFKSEEPTTEPDVQGFLQDSQHQQRLAQLGREGWELISVQPVVKGEVKIGSSRVRDCSLSPLTPPYVRFRIRRFN